MPCPATINIFGLTEAINEWENNAGGGWGVSYEARLLTDMWPGKFHAKKEEEEETNIISTTTVIKHVWWCWYVNDTIDLGIGCERTSAIEFVIGCNIIQWNGKASVAFSKWEMHLKWSGWIKVDCKGLWSNCAKKNNSSNIGIHWHSRSDGRKENRKKISMKNGIRIGDYYGCWKPIEFSVSFTNARSYLWSSAGRKTHKFCFNSHLSPTMSIHHD